MCIEQPRRRKAERFETNELVTLFSDGQDYLRQLVDISISGARVAGIAPAAKDGAMTCRIRNCIVEAKIIRVSADFFAISFDGSLAVRFAMIRHFYSSQYVKAFEKGRRRERRTRRHATIVSIGPSLVSSSHYDPTVMAGLVPAIHAGPPAPPWQVCRSGAAWMAGTSPRLSG